MPDTLGSRIARARRDRGLTQQQLADAAQVSVDVIARLEQGRQQSARLDSLVRIAQKLDMPVADLIGKPEGLLGPTQDGQVLTLRRTLVNPAAPVGDPPTVEQLREQLAGLWVDYWHAAYPRLVGSLPAALTDSRARVRAAVGDEERRAARAILAEVLQIVASTLTHLACEDLAHRALLEATWTADEVGDPLLRGTLQATMTWVLARQGLWPEAEALAISAAAELDPRIGKATPDELAVVGELWRYGTTALSRHGRAAEAQEMQQLVAASAAAMGPRRSSFGGLAPFGPVIADMAAVGIAVATSDPRTALSLADRVGDISPAPVAVQGRYLLNVAYALTENRRNTAAVGALRRVQALAPEVLRQQTIAHSIVTVLLDRRRQQRLPGLVEIARGMGHQGV